MHIPLCQHVRVSGRMDVILVIWYLQAQSQKALRINELASLKTDLHNERVENIDLRNRLCEACMQLDEVAVAKQAGDQELNMTEQVLSPLNNQPGCLPICPACA